MKWSGALPLLGLLVLTLPSGSAGGDDVLFLEDPAVPFRQTAAFPRAPHPPAAAASADQQPPIEQAPPPWNLDGSPVQPNPSLPPGAGYNEFCDGCLGDGSFACVERYLFGLIYGCRSTCNMPLHFPYFPPLHGYYYFQPYHHSHVCEHQALAPTLLGDWRSPYATLQFEKFYSDLEVAADVPLPGARNLALQPLQRRTRPLPRLEELLD